MALLEPGCFIPEAVAPVVSQSATRPCWKCGHISRTKMGQGETTPVHPQSGQILLWYMFSQMGMQEKRDETHHSGVIFPEFHVVENEDNCFHDSRYDSPNLWEGKRTKKLCLHVQIDRA